MAFNKTIYFGDEAERAIQKRGIKKDNLNAALNQLVVYQWGGGLSLLEFVNSSRDCLNGLETADKKVDPDFYLRTIAHLKKMVTRIEDQGGL